MVKIKNTLLFLLFLALFYEVAGAQDNKNFNNLLESQIDTMKLNYRKPTYLKVGEKDIIKMMDAEPNFGIFHDNYFIGGIPTDRSINRHTSDIKFQVSVRHRLTNTVLPFKTYLMLTYTQKAFWNILESSAPFRDLNFNPGLILVKPLVNKNHLVGALYFGVEHESNGKDSTASRSINYLVASASYFFNPTLSAQLKLWYSSGSMVGENNKDIYSKYRGYGLVAVNFRTLNDRLWCSAVLNPRKDFNFNTTLELNFKLSPRMNNFLFLQWYNGYAEGLYDYRNFDSMVRLGICIKPKWISIY